MMDLLTDDAVMSVDHFGVPAIPLLMRNESEFDQLKSTPASLRPLCVMRQVLATVAEMQRDGCITSEAAANAINQEVLAAMQGFKGMQRCASPTDNFPWAYGFMLKVLLYMFVYTLPFVLSNTMRKLTPLCTAIAALCFCGIDCLTFVMQAPFSFKAPNVDLDKMSVALYEETGVLHRDMDPAGYRAPFDVRLAGQEELKAMIGGALPDTDVVRPILLAAKTPEEADAERTEAPVAAEMERL